MKEERTIKVMLMDKDSAIFARDVWTVEIDDEAGGEFIVVKSGQEDLDPGKILIDPDEWPQLRALIDRMVSECRPPTTPSRES